MAYNTIINFTLQARDWETLVGIVGGSADPDIQEMVFALATYVRSTTPKPSGTTNVTIATTEGLVTKIGTYLNGNTVYNIAKDSGTSPYTRIMSAVRSANNALDNYISLTLADADSQYAARAAQIRMNGRHIIMMNSYDNQ